MINNKKHCTNNIETAKNTTVEILWQKYNDLIEPILNACFYYQFSDPINGNAFNIATANETINKKMQNKKCMSNDLIKLYKSLSSLVFYTYKDKLIKKYAFCEFANLDEARKIILKITYTLDIEITCPSVGGVIIGKKQYKEMFNK